MTDDATKVAVGYSGAIYYAPTGTTMPTSATADLDSAFSTNPFGYLDEEGVKILMNNSTEVIRSWQRGDTVREIPTEQEAKFSFTSIELNPVSLEAFFGNYVEIDSTSGEIDINGDALPQKAWVIDVLDGDRRLRFAYPLAQVTERGEIPIGRTAPVSLPFTVTAYPVDGSKGKIYIDHDVNVSS